MLDYEVDEDGNSLDPDAIASRAKMSQYLSEMLASGLYDHDPDAIALMQAQARGDYKLGDKLGKALSARLHAEGRG